LIIGFSLTAESSTEYDQFVMDPMECDEINW